MPVFQIVQNKLQAVPQKSFTLEKDLQILIEENLEEVFNCRFLASEFSTGIQHGGRIDSLALSEENHPVIIEYKKVQSSDLISQSLFYLHWIRDHQGDFEIEVQKKLGNSIKVDWSDIRMICIAPEYKKYDLHAVQVMGANIELWKYRLFSDCTLHLEDVSPDIQKERVSRPHPLSKNPGRKAARTRATGVYEVDAHVQKGSKEILGLVQDLREFITGLGMDVRELAHKNYIAYRVSRNIVCMKVRRKKIVLYLSLKPSEVTGSPENYKDLSAARHHWGTMKSHFTVSIPEEFEATKKYIELAYAKIGG